MTDATTTTDMIKTTTVTFTSTIMLSFHLTSRVQNNLPASLLLADNHECFKHLLTEHLFGWSCSLLLLTDVIHYSVTSVAYRRTTASQALQLSTEAHTGTSSTTDWKCLPGCPPNMAATNGRRHWPVCWCCPDRKPRSFDVEYATTLSSDWVSEWVSQWSSSAWWLFVRRFVHKFCYFLLAYK